ncbi:hypothetical protein ACA910_002038 [Epithemia clementina (nom. ined.)]
MTLLAISTGRDLDLARDQLCALFVKEASYQIRSVPCQMPPQKRVTTEDWRRKICQWSYRVVDSFRLDRSTVSVAMNLLDRFLMKYNFPLGSRPVCHCISCKRSFDSRFFQLASMTCLYISIKVNPEVECEEEVERRRHFRLAPFVDFSRGLFSQQDVLEMEKLILHTVGWRVNPPTATSFVPYLLDLLPPVDLLPHESRPYYPLVQQVLRELARYLCELSVCLGREMMASKPSDVAFVSLTVAMELLTLHALPPPARAYFHDAFTAFTPHYDAIYMETLRCKLLSTLAPEMLLDTQHAQVPHDPGHPIALARYYGLLDLTRLRKSPAENVGGSNTSYTTSSTTPPSSPHRICKVTEVIPISPVSIATSSTL